ncbi:MAG: terminase [Halothiobacillaceae bacterium]|nr:MAG: terminase [Halothiobacillaceae bacterium]
MTPILYPYQRRYLADASRFKAGMWSRQTGKTFTTTLEAVLDVLEAEAEGRISRWTILSVSQARAIDAMDNGVKLHLRAFKAAFEALEMPLESDELAQVVKLPGGSYIRAIAAKPSTARGMSDNLILDEFAHHQDNRAIWTALLPVVSKPGLKLRVISTPGGVGDKFHEIMTAPDSIFSRHVVTIHDAVADGLPRDIEELRRAMSDPEAWAQEFECQFVDAASAWLPYELIAACEAQAIGPYEGGSCFIGMDFAARGDLTVISVLEEVGDVLWLREMIELRRTSFAEQLAHLDRIMRDYRVTRAALDQTGLGEMPVQEAKRRHGNLRVEGVLFSAARKLDMATALKQRFEDRAIRIPPRPELRADLHAVKRESGPTGAPRLVAERTDAGHADRFWSLSLAAAAASTGDRLVIAPFEAAPRHGHASRLTRDLPTRDTGLW